MRKPYNKPEISFENFKLSTSVAGTCTLDGTQSNENSCGYDTGIGVIFISKATGCSFETQDGTEGGICYDNPSADSRVFGS